ncbi:MAG TPA: EF-hand domain-containing protein [Polyangiaceae bacterium]|jgi:Ca2+-binding EF-hand superfamily protein|nr:EF-hand domain-containing protein [Polyangiaceae bacterium]
MSDGTSGELKGKFDQFDTDRNGSISESEFTALVAALGLTLSAGQIQIAFSAIDVNGNGRIDFGEFATWWAGR